MLRVGACCQVAWPCPASSSKLPDTLHAIVILRFNPTSRGTCTQAVVVPFIYGVLCHTRKSLCTQHIGRRGYIGILSRSSSNVWLVDAMYSVAWCLRIESLSSCGTWFVAHASHLPFDVRNSAFTGAPLAQGTTLATHPIFGHVARSDADSRSRSRVNLLMRLPV